MSAQSRREWIKTQRARYRRVTRREKGWMLDEGCRLFGVHRKSLIRALGRPSGRRAKRRGRKRLYGPELLEPIKRVWLAAEQPCAKRLKALLPQWLPFYERHYEALEAKTSKALLAACASQSMGLKEASAESP